MNETGRAATLANANDSPARKWRRGGRVLATASLTILAGCAGGDVILEKPSAGYVRDIAAQTANVDWSKAEIHREYGRQGARQEYCKSCPNPGAAREFAHRSRRHSRAGGGLKLRWFSTSG